MFKHYKKINEKIIIDTNDDLNDVSINYSYHKINNNIDILNKHVTNILNNNDIQNNYNEIMRIYNNYGMLYKPKNLNAINNIIIKFRNFNYDNDDFNFSIDWINFDNIIMIIMKNNDEIPLNLINQDNFKNAMFVKIINDQCGHDIILAAENISETLKWNEEIIYQKNFNNSDCITNSEKAENDYNGYEHTYNNINVKNYQNYPALQYCKNLSIQGYKGYLPALGELFFCEKYDYLLKQVFNKLHTSFISHHFLILSSTEFSSYGNYGNYWNDAVVALKIKSYDILPMFKK